MVERLVANEKVAGSTPVSRFRERGCEDRSQPLSSFRPVVAAAGSRRNPVGTMLVALAVLTLLAGVAYAGDLDPQTDEALRTAKEIHVATRRPNGEWSRAVPIWFHWDGELVYFTTSSDSWKAKRIRNGSPVRIHAGGAGGPAFTGSAEIVTDPEVIRAMADAYAEKYWIAWLGLFRPRVSRIESGKTVAVRVTPASLP